MKNRNDIVMKKTATENKNTSDQELEQALKTIHEKYGNDFQAFLRDANESLRKRRSETRQADSCYI